MKNLILATIAVLFATGCSQKSLPLSSDYKGNNYSYENPKQYATVLANPSYQSTIYYRDANGTLLPEENNIYQSPSDTLSANYRVYYRSNERYKKFSHNIIKEKICCDNYSNNSYRRMSSTLDSK